VSALLRTQEHAEAPDDGDPALTRHHPRLAVIDEQDRPKRYRERDRCRLARVETRGTTTSA